MACRKSMDTLRYNYLFVGQRAVCRVSGSLSSKSSTSSRISVHHISNILERLKNKQVRSSTAANYLSVWRHLNKFIIRLDYRDNLSWEQKTALFRAYLVDGEVQSSTLKSYFSAIKHVLKQDGYPWNDKIALLDSLVRSCKLENDRLKIRLPIKKKLLELLMFEICRFYNQEQPQVILKGFILQFLPRVLWNA